MGSSRSGAGRITSAVLATAVLATAVLATAVLATAVFGMPGSRGFRCSNPSTPSAMNRACQRQTQVFDLPVRALIAPVPDPAAENRMTLLRLNIQVQHLRPAGHRMLR